MRRPQRCDRFARPSISFLGFLWLLNTPQVVGENAMGTSKQVVAGSHLHLWSWQGDSDREALTANPGNLSGILKRKSTSKSCPVTPLTCCDMWPYTQKR